MFPAVKFLSPRLINYPSGSWAWYSPSRPHFNLWVGVQGTGRLRVNHQVYTTSPGFAILLHPDDEAEGDKALETRFCNIGLHFNPMLTEGSNLDFSAYRMRPIVMRHFAVVRELANYMTYLIDTPAEAHSDELDTLAGQVLRIFMQEHQFGQQNPVDVLVREQAEKMRNHPEAVWTVEGMAEAVELSTSQFTRRFTEIFNMPPHTFLIQQRLDRAQELLAESRLSINEIAETLGYRDVAFFSRQFKSHVGVPPSAIRKRLRQITGKSY